MLTIILALGCVLGIGSTGFLALLSLKLRTALYNLTIEKKPLTVIEEKIVYKEIKIATKAPALIAKHPHDLSDVYISVNGYGEKKGWYYKCTCGRMQPALDKKNISESTEELAIAAWKAHREAYKDLPYSTTEEHNHLVDELNEAKRKLATCFCHDLQEPKKEVEA